MNVVHAR